MTRDTLLDNASDAIAIHKALVHLEGQLKKKTLPIPGKGKALTFVLHIEVVEEPQP